MKKVLLALWLLLVASAANAATLVPNGQQQFIDGNGNPYASGLVYFYSNYPTCTIAKNTWQDSGGTILNTNPVVLDAAGRATIFGSGAYCQVLKDSLGNTIWSKYTADTTAAAGVSWGGTSGGTANAQTVTSSSFSGIDGQTIYFFAGLTNTGSTTLAVSGGSTIAIVKPTAAGPVFLSGGEIVANNVVGVTYVQSTGQFQLITNDTGGFGATATLAGAATTNLNSIPSHVVNVTGSGTTITSFGSGGAGASVNSVYYVTFAGANTITYNATSMITPSGSSITTSAGDSLVAVYLGGSNWQILEYNYVNPPTYVNAQTGTTYTLLATDYNKLVTLTNGSAIAVTLPQAITANGFPNGFQTFMQNLGSTVITLTPTTSTINGASSLMIWPGGSLTLTSDGANWVARGNYHPITTVSAASNTGTSVTFTGLPSGIKEVIVTFAGVSWSATSNDIEIEISQSGTFATGTYVSNAGLLGGASGTTYTGSTTGGYILTNSTTTIAASDLIYGHATLINPTGTTWIENGLLITNAASQAGHVSAGTKATLGGTLDGVRVNVLGGASFDAGNISVTYQ